MENSKIEWTDHTFNPWWGCMKVSEGCKNCYAESLDNRYHNANPHWGPGSSRKPQSEAYWKQPLKWNAEAKKAGKPARVFCASMADVFEGHAETLQHLKRLLALIEQRPWLTWQLLTKRPENIIPILELQTNWLQRWPANVITGTSVENQEAANKRIPHLLQVPGPHFLSMEPLLGPVDLSKIVVPNVGMPYHYLNVVSGVAKSRLFDDAGRQMGTYMETTSFGKVQWVIVGGESGPKARPMHPYWVRSIQQQCAGAGVPFFFKQWGEWRPGASHDFYPENKPLQHLEADGNWSWIAGDSDTTVNHSLNFTGQGQAFEKLGKHAAGRILDGKEYNELPEVNPMPA